VSAVTQTDEAMANALKSLSVTAAAEPTPVSGSSGGMVVEMGSGMHIQHNEHHI
jgi:hypothetical protein